MANIQEEILKEFYEQLAKAGGFTASVVKELRELFSGTKKPKAVDVTKALSKPTKENVP
jgi:hypothetical protein